MTPTSQLKVGDVFRTWSGSIYCVERADGSHLTCLLLFSREYSLQSVPWHTGIDPLEVEVLSANRKK